METKIKFKTTDEYIATFPENVQVLLEKMRKTIKQAAPSAVEVISYNMPAFKLNGVIVYYAAYKEHIGFYPTPSGIVAFEKELKNYQTSKGAIQFPIEKGVPVTLVKDIVKFRVKEDAEKALVKKKK